MLTLDTIHCTLRATIVIDYLWSLAILISPKVLEHRHRSIIRRTRYIVHMTSANVINFSATIDYLITCPYYSTSTGQRQWLAFSIINVNKSLSRHRPFDGVRGSVVIAECVRCTSVKLGVYPLH